MNYSQHGFRSRLEYEVFHRDRQRQPMIDFYNTYNWKLTSHYHSWVTPNKGSRTSMYITYISLKNPNIYVTADFTNNYIQIIKEQNINGEFKLLSKQNVYNQNDACNYMINLS